MGNWFIVLSNVTVFFNFKISVLYGIICGLGSVPGLGRSPEGEHGNSLQYSCLENPQRQRSFVGCSPWGWKEWDMTEWLSTHTEKKTDLPFKFSLLVSVCFLQTDLYQIIAKIHSDSNTLWFNDFMLYKIIIVFISCQRTLILFANLH